MIEKKAGSDDEKIFNETLKRMLQTPPKPHENVQAPKKKGGSVKPPSTATKKR